MSVRANLTAPPDRLSSALTHLKHEELITGDSDCKIKLQTHFFFSNDGATPPKWGLPDDVLHSITLLRVSKVMCTILIFD